MDRNEAIVSLMPLVSQIARKVQRQVPSYALDDLVSEGMIGAIHAVDRFDEEHGTALPAFANRRIHGQIWDYVRATSPLGRKDYEKVLDGEAHPVSFSSIDAPVHSSPDDGNMSLADLLPDDEDAITRMVDQLAIRTVMGQVPEKFQDILQAYYYAGMTLKQIGNLRGVSESRISQQLREAHDWAYHYLVA